MAFPGQRPSWHLCVGSTHSHAAVTPGHRRLGSQSQHRQGPVVQSHSIQWWQAGGNLPSLASSLAQLKQLSSGAIWALLGGGRACKTLNLAPLEFFSPLNTEDKRKASLIFWNVSANLKTEKSYLVSLSLTWDRDYIRPRPPSLALMERKLSGEESQASLMFQGT